MSYRELSNDEYVKVANAYKKRMEAAEKKYIEYFGSFPERIMSWGDPLKSYSDTKYWDECVADMEKDVEQAIASDTPFKEIPEDIWKQIIF